MSTLKYKVIKDKEQYGSYCRKLESTIEKANSQNYTDEIELLTLLIETYHREHTHLSDIDPVALLQSLMADHHLKAKGLADYLSISKGYGSDILNYKKGLSKDVIRKLAERFKVSQEAFNRPYPLQSQKFSPLRHAGIL